MVQITSKVKQKIDKIDPKTKDILILLGAGTFLAASIIFPALPIIVGKGLKAKDEQEWKKAKKDWDKYNLWRLRQVIKRMQQSRFVEIVEGNGAAVVKITEKGRRKLLSYNLETMKLDETKWDGKWRLVIYDVKANKKLNSEMFRRALTKLNLLKLQKSVYLTPFRCEDHIEYLRQLFEIGDEVLILKVGSLENEFAYRKYFGI